MAKKSKKNLTQHSSEVSDAANKIGVPGTSMVSTFCPCTDQSSLYKILQLHAEKKNLTTLPVGSLWRILEINMNHAVVLGTSQPHLVNPHVILG